MLKSPPSDLCEDFAPYRCKLLYSTSYAVPRSVALPPLPPFGSSRTQTPDRRRLGVLAVLPHPTRPGGPGVPGNRQPRPPQCSRNTPTPLPPPPPGQPMKTYTSSHHSSPST